MLCKRSLPFVHCSCKLNFTLLSSHRPSSSSSTQVDTPDTSSGGEVAEVKVIRPASAHFKPFTNTKLTEAYVWPYKDITDKLYSEAEKRDKAFLAKKYGSDLRFNKDDVLEVIKRPEVQAFIDELEDRFLAELPKRKEEADQSNTELNQTKMYPQSLMGLDPFNYIREEEALQEFLHDDMPLGADDMVSTGQILNKYTLRTPLDFAYIIKNEGLKKGVGQFFRLYFMQGKAALGVKFKSLKNRGYDHAVSSRSLRNSPLAFQLQELYLKHFELIADGRWNVLLDYMADFKVVDLKATCELATPQALKSWFTVKFIKNNKKPEVISHMEAPHEDKTYLQVLVKLDMEVECMTFDEDRNGTISQQNMVHYVVFERNVADFLSNFRIIDKVSEEDLQFYKRHGMDTEKEEKTV